MGDTPKKWYQENTAALIAAAATIIAALIGLVAVLKNDSPEPVPPSRPPIVSVSKSSLPECYKYDAKVQVVHFKIQPNMTASSLSRLFAVPVHDILRACGTDGVLHADSECKIPMPGWRVAIYEVQTGDTPFSLERRFHLPRGAPILEWNCLDTLQSGRSIQIFLSPAVEQDLTHP
jgi:hypothetical protein